MTIVLKDPFAQSWQQEQAFSEVRRLLRQAEAGAIVRAKEGRQTIRFDYEGRRYYLKYHSGIGWGEIVKCWLQLKQPVTGAGNEWRAISRLQQLGVDTLTPVAFGERGFNPARRESFLITEELTGILSLAKYTEQWPERPPAFVEKRRLTEKVAGIARTLHNHGINHRDFYLCHFLLKVNWNRRIEPALHVVDLHRAQCRARVPRRWVVKDIAGLYFSSMETGLGRRDIYRFLRYYFAAPLRTIFEQHGGTLRAVERKARQIYRRDFSRPAPDLLRPKTQAAPVAEPLFSNLMRGKHRWRLVKRDKSSAVYKVPLDNNGWAIAKEFALPSMTKRLGFWRKRRRLQAFYRALAGQPITLPKLLTTGVAKNSVAQGYILYTLLPGLDLRHVRWDIFPPQALERIGGEIGTALYRIHATNWVHGDFKFANVVLNRSGADSVAIAIVDLESVSKVGLFSGPKPARDIARFLLNGLEVNVPVTLLASMWRSYCAGLAKNRERAMAGQTSRWLEQLRARHVRKGEAAVDLNRLAFLTNARI